ncbi:MAG TPA: NAD-dependent epimerase/dehydratase family protein, partial [Deltaproteobacteria bacterium]|nr:NAD-dependent epimerase/dehydratase family protein [Deltaproteobacteria bacterium]
MERAGSAVLRDRRVGLWCGLSTHEYGARTVREDRLEQVQGQAGPGNAGAAAVGRVAYHLGLRGPAVVIDTACSSSLVAVHHAIQSLRLRECDAALAAGVNVVLSASVTLAFARMGVLSPSGGCRPFDTSADGYVRGDGCGVVVLRRLSDAIAEGDPILAVILGSAVNNSGGGAGLTAPSRGAWRDVIDDALAAAGLQPDQIGYVEAFGSATPMGDATELLALCEVFGARPLAVGCAKGVLGHSEAASGIAALIRAALAVHHGTILPTPWVRRPREEAGVLRFGGSCAPWPGQRPRLAGISGFGFGGTNAHLIVSSVPPTEPSASTVSSAASGAVERSPGGEPGQRPHLLMLSARTPEALEVRRASLSSGSLGEICRAAAAAEPLSVRRAWVIDALPPEGEGIRGLEGRPVFVTSDRACGPPSPLGSLPRIAELRSRQGPEALLSQVAAGLAWIALGIRPAAVVAGPGGELAAGCLRGLWSLDEALAHAAAGRSPPLPEYSVPPGPRLRLDLQTRAEVLEVAGALFVGGAPLDRVALLGPGPRAPGAPHPLQRTIHRSALLDDLELGHRVGPRRVLPQLVELVGIGPDDPLEALALDSIQIVELIGALQQRGIHLYPDELGSAPTLRALAQRLEGGGTDDPGDGAIERIRALLEAQHSAIAPPEQRLAPAAFILSAPRSGSTLLRVMLAGHPDLFAPPELHLLGYADLAARARALGPRLLDRGLHHALIGTGLSAPEATAAIEAMVEAGAPVSQAYASLQQRIGSRLLIDKTPTYALDPGALAQALASFSSPRFVILTRHPEPVTASFAQHRLQHLLADPSLDPYAAGEAVWQHATEQLMRFAAGLDDARRCWIRFEDLIHAPEPVLRRLLAFLGVPWHEAVLTPYAGDRMSDAHIGDPSFRTHSRIDLEHATRTVHLPRPLSRRTLRLARAIGYEHDELPDDLVISPRPPGGWPPRRILVTGGTGFLGGHLIRVLQRRVGPDTEIFALVRASDPAAAAARLPGVSVICGDLADALPRLQDMWFDLVIHAAAVVSFGLPYSRIRKPNVLGTLRMIQLAARCGARLHHVSSKGVFDAARWPGDQVIPEDAPLRPPGEVIPYQRSKWASERLVQLARDRGLDASVSRPGRIGPDASGQLPPHDFLARFLAACRAVAAVPTLQMPLEIVPVDQVAEAIVSLALHEDPPAVCHLTHPAPLELSEVQRILGLDAVPFADWRAAVLALASNPLAGVIEGIERDPQRVHE